MSELLNKILTHQQLTEEEVESICRLGHLDVDFPIKILDESYSGLKNRWHIPTNIVFSVFDANENERCFSLEYEEGLTEYQEDFFYEQVAVEVEEKFIVTQVWEKKQDTVEE